MQDHGDRANTRQTHSSSDVSGGTIHPGNDEGLQGEDEVRRDEKGANGKAVGAGIFSDRIQIEHAVFKCFEMVMLEGAWGSKTRF